MMKKYKLFSYVAILLIGILVLTGENPVPANAYLGEPAKETVSLSRDMILEPISLSVWDKQSTSGFEEINRELVLFQTNKIKNRIETKKGQAEPIGVVETTEEAELVLDAYETEKAGTSLLEASFGRAEEKAKTIKEKAEKEKKVKEAKAKKKKTKQEAAAKKEAVKEQTWKWEALTENQTAGRTLQCKKQIKLSAKEVECLQRIVQAEAGTEDIMGKLLVANVVLNRYRNKWFPNSIEEIVTQTSYGNYGLVYQFTPTKPGGGYWNAVPSKETIEAVERALDGEDYSEGALYFANRQGADPTHMSWFDRKLTRLFQHGNHEFYVD